MPTPEVPAQTLPVPPPTPAAAAAVVPPAIAAATPPLEPVAPPPVIPAAAPVKPDGLDAAYWDDKLGLKAELLTSDLASLKAAKAENDIRLQGVPETADKYKISLDGWQAPEGVEVAIDDTHPLSGPAKAFAHKWHIPQEGMNDLVRMQADYVVAEAVRFKTDMAAQRELLGTNAQARIEAVTTALAGRLGEAAKPLLGLMVSAGVVEAFESMLRVTQAPGPSARTAAATTAPDLSKLSTVQKFDYHYNNQPRPRA